MYYESESEVAQSCLTLCDSMACSLPGFSVHGIFQASILEWVTISFSRRSSRPRDWTQVSHIVGRCFTVWATRDVQNYAHEMECKIYLLLLSCFRHVWLCATPDGSPPGSLLPGILLARTLEWVATSFSNAWKWKGKVKSLSRLRLFATPWTAAHQAPLSMGFSRQEYWSGVPLPSVYNEPCFKDFLLI